MIPRYEQAEEKLNRRELLRMSVAGLAAPLAGTQPERRPRRGLNRPIAAENRKTGTADWQLTYTRPQTGTNYRSNLVEGYCSRTSVRPGETIDFFLSADPATAVTIDLYRMGYYGGKGGRFFIRLGPFHVTPQPDPAVGTNRLRECRWQRTAELKVPGDWLSGVYLGKLSCRDHRYQSYVLFVIRDDRHADLLFQCSDNTWQAYNKWPDEYSLYDSDPPRKPLNGTTRVSFDRPYGKYPQVVDQPLSQGSGEFLCWEFPLCYWLERQGYDVTYCSSRNRWPTGSVRISNASSRRDRLSEVAALKLLAIILTFANRSASVDAAAVTVVIKLYTRLQV